MSRSEPPSADRVDKITLPVGSEAKTVVGPLWNRGTRNRSQWRDRWWLHLLLFALTFITTTVFGYALAVSFSAGHALSDELIGAGYALLIERSPALWRGIAYSIPLLLILLAHELGHYFTCLRWKVEASLPYFGPAPTALGTVGAFIRIRTPIFSRRSLFDIGVSGPLAGFCLLLPILLAGVVMSRVDPSAELESQITFGTPLLLRVMEAVRFPVVPPSHVLFHPVAMAAWAGMLATAINLLPVGQLDGGHISYALLGERGHRIISLIVVALLAAAGFFYWSWWIWAAVMYFLRRHPLVYDFESLGSGRRRLALVALCLLIVCFSVVPVQVR